jgi:hypothetical protein
MDETPRFMQGIYCFEGQGLENPVRLEPPVSYRVAKDRRAHFIYARIGNPNPELVYFLLTRNEKPMRYFAAGAKGAMHIPLSVIEDIESDTELEILIGAPAGLKGQVIIDFGLTEF